MHLMGYDFETSGLPLFSEPSDDPRQPHIVQAAARLVSIETREVVDTISAIAKPDGWEIPEEVAKIHGITTERALAEGIPEKEIVDMLLAMWRRAEFRVAHNEGFDARIMRIALKRFVDAAVADEWKAGKKVCTQGLSTKILKIGKTAGLGEAHEFFFGTALVDAHTADADADGCLAVYWAIQDLGKAPVRPVPKPEPASEPDTGGSALPWE